MILETKLDTSEKMRSIFPIIEKDERVSGFLGHFSVQCSKLIIKTEFQGYHRVEFLQLIFFGCSIFIPGLVCSAGISGCHC